MPAPYFLILMMMKKLDTKLCGLLLAVFTYANTYANTHAYANTDTR